MKDVVGTGRRTILRGAALSVVSGLLIVLSYTNFGLRFTALVCLAPLLVAIEGVSPRRALFFGWIAGFVFQLAGYYWLIGTLGLFGGFPLAICVLLYMILAFYQGGQIALFAWIVARGDRAGAPWLVSVPLAIAAVEKLYPLLFPSYLASGLHEVPILFQAADLGGPIFVSVLIALINLGLAEVALARTGGRPVRWRQPVLAVGVLAMSLIYGAVRIAQVDRASEAAPRLKVGMVQANVSIGERSIDPTEGHRRHVAQSVELKETEAPDLLVWPESGYFRVISPGIEWLGPIVTGPRIKTPLVFGAARRDREGRVYNTAFMLDAEGRVTGSYDKTHLLMFGEYIPFGDIFPWLYDISRGSGQMSAGTHQDPFTVGDYRFSVLICYEDLLPGFTRDAVRAGSPHFLVNLTNDAWFGDTLEPWLHLALAKLRTVENRRWLVRSTNTGVSALIDPVGRVTVSGDLFVRQNLVGDIRILEGDTLWVMIGDVAGVCGVIGALLLVIAGSPRIRRRRSVA